MATGESESMETKKPTLIDEANSKNPVEEEESSEVVQIPQVGMVFKSEEEIRTFYREYAYYVGFGTTKKSAKRDGDVRYFSLVCSRQGTYLSKSSLPFRTTTKVNCKAKLNVKVSRDGEFEITKVELRHNHDLSPGRSRRFKCNKRIHMNVKRTLELNDEGGIRVNKKPRKHGAQADRHDEFTFSQNESQTCSHKVGQLTLEEGDAQALQQYFCRMQKKDEKFYYVMDINEGHLRNVFWADARSRSAYQSYSDVITFDSTYLANKDNMPIALFLGVNHHGHSILLGCALLSNEDIETYIWLFRCWLDCMLGRAPHGIVTDQCEAMHIAIREVFPETQHRFCLWHIMKKLPQKIGTYAQYGSIKKTLEHVVYESLRQSEFEVGWFEMVENFDLQTNEWLGSLYHCRKMWVPVYLKKYFWAGMSTTERSENIIDFLDDFIPSKTSLKQFVREFNNALCLKVQKENHADFVSFSRVLPLVSELHIEKQFHVVYTQDILKKFQAELKGLLYCNASLRKVDGPIYIYEVTESIMDNSGNSWKEIILEVEINEIAETMDCLCGLFQFKGIMCRHIVKSMIKKRMNKAPEKYCLDRWRKDIKRSHTLIKSSYDNFENDPQIQRYDELCKLSQGAAELASRDIEKSKLWKEYIVQGMQTILGIAACMPPSTGCPDEINLGDCQQPQLDSNNNYSTCEEYKI